MILEIKEKITQKSVRNYGIDMLRIFSMINIINLHINLYFGLLNTKYNDSKYKSIWRLEIFSLFPVNCFGLISGVVGYKKYKFSKLIYLWFIGLYYSVLQIFLSSNGKIKFKNLILSFLPLLNRFHWFVNAYFIMYLTLPFINYGINSLNKIIYSKLIIIFILFFSFYHIIHVLMKTADYSFLLSGYSSFWLMILYIIGGYLGKYVLGNSSYFVLRKKLLYVLIYFLSSFFSEIYQKQKLFINYLSPTILCQAIVLLLFFSSIIIKNSIIIKIISFIIPLNFSATFIHRIIFNHKKTHSLLEKVKDFDNNLYFFKIYGLSILIYFSCIIIDFFRKLIFNAFNITKICEFLEHKIQN